MVDIGKVIQDVAQAVETVLEYIDPTDSNDSEEVTDKKNSSRVIEDAEWEDISDRK